MEERSYTEFYARFLGGFTLTFGGQKLYINVNPQVIRVQILFLLLKAGDQGIQKAGNQVTSGGVARFAELTQGLYLICQERGEQDNVTFGPFLTVLPVMDEITHAWNYDVTAFTKHEPDRPEPTEPGGPTEPGSNDPSRPTSNRPGNGGSSSGDPAALVELEEPPVPHSGLEQMLDEIIDMVTPLAVLPRTGDDSLSNGILILILVVSGTLTLCLIRRRRKQHTKK